ncbi:MAG TPA: DUF1802 family protein [Thermoanaerobaculia bacterium]
MTAGRTTADPATELEPVARRTGKLPNHTALKEWANVVEALGRGEQIILIRKGGLADPAFGIDADQFYLYPTYFHQGESDARPFVTLTHWAEIVRTWRITDRETLTRLEPFVVIPRETLDARYRFRSDQALYVLALRAWELPAPIRIPFREQYGGCLSWISVEEEIDVEGSRPVLAPEVLTTGVEAIDRAIAAAG